MVCIMLRSDILPADEQGMTRCHGNQKRNQYRSHVRQSCVSEGLPIDGLSCPISAYYSS